MPPAGGGIEIRGERLRVLRHQKRLTAEGLGKLVGRTFTQVYRVEHEESRTSLDFLDRLVPVFGQESVAELIAGEQDRQTFLGRHSTSIEDEPGDVADSTDTPPSERWGALGDAVRKRRLELGIPTQGEAAKLAGVSLNTYHRLENGVAVGRTSLVGVAGTLGWDQAHPLRILSGSLDNEADVPTQRGAFSARARSLCEQAMTGAEGGWVPAEVGAFAAAVLAALDQEEAR